MANLHRTGFLNRNSVLFLPKGQEREEWNLLVDWVYSGHSPYMNGDGVFDDDGWPLDFINTLRSWDAQQECFDSLSDEDQESIREQAKKDAAEVPESDGFFLPKDFVESFDIPFY